jgi:hypothetical protein
MRRVVAAVAAAALVLCLLILMPPAARAEALQRTQMAMMKKYDNPYYWGAFVLYGDYR